MVCQRVFILFLTLLFGHVQGEEVIDIGTHRIHGTTMTTRNGRNISAYLGIPYAEPPIGPLRFRSPVPWKKRDGPIIADTVANQCPQLNSDGQMVGDEDCLYLNVYKPQAKENVLIVYPVMVYLHGGNFVRGSSEEAGPEYLLDKDIVLVTVNYRLGALGFLSTGDAAAPGNFGLKDQALALKWVRTYILAFEGHLGKVTIFGHDAGGVSTVLLAMSPTSQGLFDQYIAQSGSPLAFWAIATEQRDHYHMYAEYLGRYLKCPIAEPFALVKCLRSVDVSTLLSYDNRFNNKNAWLYRSWTPTLEPKGLADSFLTDLPAESAIFRKKWIKACPAIIGLVSDEGLGFTADLYANDRIYDSITMNLDQFLISLVDKVVGDNKATVTSKIVKKFYFESVDTTDRETFTRNMTNLITDTCFGFPTTMQCWMTEYITSPFYMYKFGYRGSYSKTSDVIGNNDNVGVCHGDELTYLFPPKNVTTQLSESDEKMIDIMVDFWTSFATNGSPTSQYIPDPNMWIPFTGEEKNLEIGKGHDPLAMSFGRPLNDTRNLFWNAITLGSLFRDLAIPNY